MRHSMTCCLLSLGLAAAGASRAHALVLAQNGETNYKIVLAQDAAPPERHAAEELARFLHESTGVEFPIVTSGEEGDAFRILVGQGAHVTAVAPDLNIGALGTDGLVVRTVGTDLILVGGRPRGTLYAVDDFLEDVVGCRWWSSKVSSVPRHRRLECGDLDVREVPVLEYREPFWFDGFDGDWAARNRANGNSERLDEAHGGKHIYKGFVHTFYPLVPPGEHFAEHPEWFSEIGGERRADGAQLCLTNPELTAFVIERVKAWLRESPDATIISVSQNDCGGRCECANCAALEAEEESPSGPLLHFVNKVAEAIEPEFPNVAVDTLAYQYTRKPPKLVRPRPNVIVRLCSIECSFSQPLDDEVNQTFADDIRGWSQVSNRLYIWDYTTDFVHYLQPHPNLRVLGPNVRFFVENGVRGIFEQGAYQSYGAEFAELRAWVLAKLLWDPYQDDEALINEFLSGYYADAAGPIREYISMMHDACEESGHYLSCFSAMTAPFLNLDTLTKAERLFDEAEAAVAGDPAVLDRVRCARQATNYVWLSRYQELKQRAKFAGTDWAGPEDFATAAREFVDFLKAHDVTMVSEGQSLDGWAQRLIDIPRREAGPPPGCENLPLTDYIDFQDSAFGLYQQGTLSMIAADESASDGAAARMPAIHREWAVQLPLFVPEDAGDTKWTYHVAIKCERKGDQGVAFTCGLYDTVDKVGIAQKTVQASEIADAEYHVYDIGEAALKQGLYLWVAPEVNSDNIEAVWVDRFFLMKAE